MTLSLGTAYRSFGGEVEASSTPTICRLPDSRRHQLWAIARFHHSHTSDFRGLNGRAKNTNRPRYVPPNNGQRIRERPLSSSALRKKLHGKSCPGRRFQGFPSAFACRHCRRHLGSEYSGCRRGKDPYDQACAKHITLFNRAIPGTVAPGPAVWLKWRQP